jgi:hypothetical protein
MGRRSVGVMCVKRSIQSESVQAAWGAGGRFEAVRDVRLWVSLGWGVVGVGVVILEVVIIWYLILVQR